MTGRTMLANRRSFLRGLAALTALPFAPKVADAEPLPNLAFMVKGRPLAPGATGRRLSADTSDPFFHSDAYRAKVYLDGKPLNYCRMADERAGECVVYVRDGRGNLMRNPGDRGRALTRTLYGQVRIEIPEDTA